jgi:hypothetical protein
LNSNMPRISLWFALPFLIAIPNWYSKSITTSKWQIQEAFHLSLSQYQNPLEGTKFLIWKFQKKHSKRRGSLCLQLVSTRGKLGPPT